MMLEDHAGDIVQKARRHAKISLETAARAAGLSASQLEAFEASGIFDSPPNWSSLAPLLGLNSEKLRQIAQGWLPAAVDLSGWRKLCQLVTFEDNYAVNSYLVWDESTREAAMFDTGWNESPILEMIRAHHLVPRHLFLTHHHEDHVAALPALCRQFPDLVVHDRTQPAPAQDRNRESAIVHLGNLRITRRDTPGHSPDSVTFLVSNFPDHAPDAAMVGDAIFAGSIGRGFQSFALLRQSIAQQIFSLSADTLLCPGHGPLTTVGEQQKYNPFFQ